ncbi:MAG: NAD(+) diphosphatase [Candidatus Pelagadaptatus aseana]|uniref:NAD(+) diphosphatase n=1 Tax=Candidatus Pelagadaptatus aseana TaxID=3120508 RepID=UPI0039B2861A
MTLSGPFVPGVIAEASSGGNTGDRLYIPICKGQLLVAEDYLWQPIHAGQWRFLNPQPDAQVHYLGELGPASCYVVEITHEEIIPGYFWDGLRALLSGLSPTMYEIAARALQVVTWDRDHRFCGRCGAETQPHNNERAKVCGSCRLEFYPRLSPCVITVVTRDEYCLLAHNPQFPARYFSALAGFVEAGETLEAALAREVKEEVNIDVGPMSYFGSQSWPFPSQLMIGFHAEYQSGEIEVDGLEIAEANWYRYDDLPLIPPEGTLSGQLIRGFVNRFQ